MAACESQCIDTGIDVCHNDTTPSRLLIYSASCLVNANAIKSDVTIDLATQVCFTDFQDIAPPQRKNT